MAIKVKYLTEDEIEKDAKLLLGEYKDTIGEPIKLPVPVDEHGLVVSALADLLAAGHRPRLVYTVVNFQNPTGATLALERRMHLAELAEQNARIALESDAAQSEQRRARRVAALEELREALNLESLPIRIECFDISNLQSASPVGSMVVFQDAVAKRSHYRKFTVRRLDGGRPRPLVPAIVREARAAGANHVWASVVNLRPGTREHFFEHLAEDWPELAPFYERLYGGRAYPPRKVEQRVREAVATASKEQSFRRGRTLRPKAPAVQLTLI